MYAGIYSIDVLKKKWKYLREKFVREKKNLQVVLLEGKGKYGAT